jgi:hypothetical protein
MSNLGIFSHVHNSISVMNHVSNHHCFRLNPTIIVILRNQYEFKNRKQIIIFLVVYSPSTEFQKKPFDYFCNIHRINVYFDRWKVM